MGRVLSLYRSSVGKKILMSVTGVVFVFFVIAHMVGNLKAFMGPEHFDEYAHFLREVGEPIFPYGVLLWSFRIVLLHFTTGQLHPDFVPGAAYRNLVLGFQTEWVAGLYIVVMFVLGLHLYHGVWSSFQTLGLNHPRYNRYRRPLAAVVAIVVFLGFVSVPVAVLTGTLS